MKRFYQKLMLLTAAVVTTSGVFAQSSFLDDPKWGDSPEDRQKNALEYNFLRDTYNNQNYDQAIGYLRGLLQNAPKASENIYIYGNNIYKNKIARSQSLDEKNAYVDSLMMLYDLRIEHFGDKEGRGKPYIMQLKARDYLTYKPADRDGIMKLFKDALAESGNDVDPDFVNIYFKELTDDYKLDNIDMDTYMSEYANLEQIMMGVDDADAKKTFEALFISSGAADCPNLEKMFSAQLAAKPDDVDLLAKAFGLLTSSGCKSDFYISVGEKYYEKQPDSQTALLVASALEEKKDYAGALKYLRAAIATETDPKTKVDLCIRIAGSEIGAGNASNAADFARQAIEINPESGLAYLVLAQAYAVGANACQGFAKQSIYWLVYDTLLKAKQLLGEDDPQAQTVDSQLATYRAGFPSKEECFFRGLKEGASCTVSCGWISGRTTVRQGN